MELLTVLIPVSLRRSLSHHGNYKEQYSLQPDSPQFAIRVFFPAQQTPGGQEAPIIDYIYKEHVRSSKLQPEQCMPTFLLYRMHQIKHIVGMHTYQ